MRAKTTVMYCCDICHAEYATPRDAFECEERPVTHTVVGVGDRVSILHGEGAGSTATVKNTWPAQKEWGHYAWKRYWHTMLVDAELDPPDSGVHRILTFDDYRKDHVQEVTNDG